MEISGGKLVWAVVACAKQSVAPRVPPPQQPCHIQICYSMFVIRTHYLFLILGTYLRYYILVVGRLWPPPLTKRQNVI